jgi:hypothetical protein
MITLIAVMAAVAALCAVLAFAACAMAAREARIALASHDPECGCASCPICFPQQDQENPR